MYEKIPLRDRIPSNELVPTKFVCSLLEIVREKGYDIRPLIDDAGLDFDPMNRKSANYQNQVSAMLYSRVYQQAMRLLQDESFGLHVGSGVTPGAFRMMCYCIISCENLGRALQRAAEFYRTFFDSAMLTLNIQSDICEVGYRSEPHRATDHQVDATDAYGLSMWHRFCGWLTGRRLKLTDVHFVGAAPENIKKYEELFHCPVHYEQDDNVLRFDSAFLTYPLVHTEHSLKEFLRTAPYQLMVDNQKDGSLVAQVRALIGHDFSQGFPAFDEVTDALHMSAPTLRRRLKREGTTYQQLKDECRKEAAIAYLNRPDLSINAVAALMGFTDPSAFHRSFKKWTGMPPGEFRRRESTAGRED